MDTNVIIAIVAVVVIAAILVIGGWWLGKTRKNAVNKSTEDAKEAADARLAAEAKSAAADSSTVKPSVDSNVDAAEKAPAESQQKSSVQASSSETAAPAPATEAKPEPVHETPESAGTRMQRLKARLSKSGNPFGKALFNILAKDQLSEADWEDVEDTLLLADVGAEASEQLVGELRNDARIAGQSDPAEVRAALKDKLLKLVGTDTDRRLNADKEGANKPSVIIMVGVNGTGKTTTAGKLSRLLVSEGKQVMLGAADTFRAAAVEQLVIWSERVGVPIVKQNMGSDPASVAFDTLSSAKANDADVVIIDTAGRLHNKINLMNELTKIKNVMKKVIPDAPHEILLVLDGSTGQNAFEQAKQFTAATEVNALAVTKLDGTAKGGVVIGISDHFRIPVKYIGLGEGMEDLQVFRKREFVNSLFGE